MSIRFSIDLKSVITRNTDDVVIFMNNSVGDWNTKHGKILSHYFPSSRASDTCTHKTKLAKLGKFTNPVKDINRKPQLLNIHVRKGESDSCIEDEVANLDKALGFLSTVLFCKNIIIVSGTNTDIDKLHKFAASELKGNAITIVAATPKSSG